MNLSFKAVSLFAHGMGLTVDNWAPGRYSVATRNPDGTQGSQFASGTLAEINAACRGYREAAFEHRVPAVAVAPIAAGAAVQVAK